MWHSNFIKRALNSDTTINDAAAYKVRIIPAQVQPGQPYWRIIGVYHLAEWENRGNAHAYLDALNQAGFRAKGTNISWGWQGQTPKQIEDTRPAIVDKPDHEPGGNIAMHSGQIIWAQVADALSDRVENVHTAHLDEPPGNTLFHHSFYIVWQLVIAGPVTPPPQPDPQPEPRPEPYQPLSRLTVWRFYGNQGWIPVWTGDSVDMAYGKLLEHRAAAGAEGHVTLQVKV